jgi:Transposase DDE domain group 1
VVHTLPALVGQRIAGIALGYEDVNDHDELRHDPVLALFAEKLEPKRSDCAPLAGKSTLNRLEHAPWRPDDRYHKIGHDPAALANLFVDLFLEAQPRPAGGAVLPRLLQLLLLFALIRILRAAPARRPAAVLEHRRLSGRCGRGGPHR